MLLTKTDEFLKTGCNQNRAYFQMKIGKKMKNNIIYILFGKSLSQEAKNKGKIMHHGYIHTEKCFVESTKISIGPYLNEKLC